MFLVFPRNWWKKIAVFFFVGGFILPPGFLYAIKQKPSLEASHHPEAVLITARNARAGMGAKCSGALIAPRVVLTAAHPVAKFDIWEVTAPYAKDGPVKVMAKISRVHPDYKSQPLENDIALLILDEEIDIGAPFPRLHDGKLLPIDTSLQLIGRVNNGEISHNRLMRTTVTLVPFPGNTNIYGGHPRAVEEGDSGGPIFVAGKEMIIVGIVSGHLGGTRANIATDLFVPISRENVDWIRKQVPKGNK
ncbi:MAG TPA: trypsin-like serine protease [Gemmataceae bacterium]|nr:trypsin-like serine protease [Gemmataceae bacterium]